MSQTIVALIVGFLAEFLPKWGIVIGNDALTNFISTGIILVSGIWIWVRRYQAGGIGLTGVRK